MAYMFLVGELAKRHITKTKLSKTLNVHRNTISYKLKNGSFSIEEAEIVQKTHFPDIPLNKLFQKE